MNTKTKPTEPADALASLADEARQITADAEAANDPDGPGQAAPPEPEQSNAELIAGVLQMVRDAGCQLSGLQTPARVATDKKLENIGLLWGKVADKRGWNIAGMLGGYAEEIAATIATVALGRELAHVITAELAARRRDVPAANDEPAPAPPAEVVG